MMNIQTRNDILNCLGKFPNRVDLNIKILNIEKFESYERLLIEYNVESDERVKTYLLIPNDRNRLLPAILAIHQHHSNWKIGKSEVVGLTNNKMYSYGLDLVKRGYVVIAPDIICFEDRMDKGEFTKNYNEPSLFERFVFCDYLLKGSTIQAKTLHDLYCAIDVLLSLEYVDKNNIGVIGHSLGGQEVIYLQWYDKRIKVGVSSCGACQINSIIDNNLLHSFYLYIPNMLNYCDIDCFIKDITYDRNLLILNGKEDQRHCPIDGIKKIEDLVINDNFKSVIFDGGHEFNDNCKNIAYQYLDNILKK